MDCSRISNTTYPHLVLSISMTFRPARELLHCRMVMNQQKKAKEFNLLPLKFICLLVEFSNHHRHHRHHQLLHSRRLGRLL